MDRNNLIVMGLTGLARAGETGWFDGHFGGAVLTAARLLKRSDLNSGVKNGIKNQLAYVIRDHTGLFSPFEFGEPNALLENKILEALKQNLSCLSISGHGVIYGALALQALKRSPQYFQASIVDGIVKLLNRTLFDRPDRYYGIKDYKLDNILLGENIPRYASVKDMIRTTFMETKVVYADGYVGDQHYFFAAEKLHGITHAHALSTLHDLGYSDLARLGFESHRKQLKLNRMLPPDPNWIRKLAVRNLTPFQPVYWQRDHFDDHALKLACATLELLDKFEKGAAADFYDSKTYWEPFMR